MANTITLSVNDVEIWFNVGVEDYNAYINEMMPNNKVGPSHNFLVRTVAKEHKQALLDALQVPGMAIQLAGAVVQEYVPEITITVKK